MTHNPNANKDRDALLQALTGTQADQLFSDAALNELIEAEFAKPVEQMDCEVLDACHQLLERRHSPFTDRQMARSQRKGLKQFKQFMKQSRVPRANKTPFPLKPVATAVLAILIFFVPALISNHTFWVTMPPDEQQYVVFGIQPNGTGVGRAFIERDIVSRLFSLNSLDEIPSVLGYQIELPTCIPAGLELTSIDIEQIEQYDEVLLIYEDAERSLFLSITYYTTRAGVGINYEQDKKGKYVPLENGATIYLATNVQSVWGLYQSAYVDYFIDAIGFDEDVILQLFNSIGRKGT
ncbi:MAG: hypothetical protein ACOX58_07860 [Christensenellales bacterium]